MRDLQGFRDLKIRYEQKRKVSMVSSADKTEMKLSEFDLECTTE